MEFLKHHKEQLITEEIGTAKGQCYNDSPLPSYYLDFRNSLYVAYRWCTQTHLFKNPFNLIQHLGRLLFLLPLTRDYATPLNLSSSPLSLGGSMCKPGLSK